MTTRTFLPCIGLALLACAAPVLAACATSRPVTPVVTTPVASVAPSSSGTPPVESAPAVASAAVYSGHGAASVPPEVLARYRPKPLSPDVSRRIQSRLDLRAPGVGRVSPDGKSLYFAWAVTGVPQIWRVDGPGRFPRQLTGGEDATTLSSITPDGRWLVVSRDRKGAENPGLYLQDAKEGGPLVEIQHKPDVQTRYQLSSPDSKYVYYSANDEKKDSYTIYRYDIAAKTKEKVFGEDGLWSVADSKDDGSLLLEKAVGGNQAEVFTWDPKTRALTPVVGQNEKEEYDVAFGNKPGEILVLTPKLGDFRRLCSWEKGKLTPITPDLKHDVSGFAIDHARTRILFQVNEGGYTRIHALDAHTEKEIALPKLPDADHVRIGPMTRDGRYASLAIDDGKHPMQSYVIDWKTSSLTSWFSPSTPEIDTTKFSRARIETYPARDGTPIPVLIRTPEKCASDPCTVIVHFHGGPESQTLPGFNVSGQMFVDAGFVFVEPNVRGSDGYGKAWLHADDGPRRKDVITDIPDAAAWAKKKFAAGGKEPKVGIFGGSYGGYSVLMGMTMFAGTFDAGVDIVGISNLLTFLQNTAPYRRILRISEYGDPEKDKDALLALSPTTYVDRVKAPLLILQGAQDPRVPAGEAIQIHEALEKKGVPGDLMIFPDEGHGAQKRENQVLMYGHSIAFFEKHLLGK